jgi:LemA protein
MTGATTTAVGGGVLCALLVVAVAGVVLAYNRLARLRGQADAAWRQVDLQLRRRNDLIPHLAQTVRRYAAHERGAFDAVVSAHGAAIAAARTGVLAERSAAEGRLTAALGRLVAVAETYPELRSLPSFVTLQVELAGVEDRLAYSRRSYEAAVQPYNRAVRRLPTNLVALVTGFRGRESFEAAAAAPAPAEARF